MASDTSSTLSGILQDPWTVVPQRTFNATFVGLIGVCQSVLLLHFARNRPEIAVPVGSGGMLLLWFAWNMMLDNDPMADFRGTDNTHGWFHLVVRSIIATAVVIATAVTLLGT